jgi:hypothetical protein
MLRAARRLSMALVAKNSAISAPTVNSPSRLCPITAITSGAMASTTGAGAISNSCATAALASASPPKWPAIAPRKMQNGNSDRTKEYATAPAIENPLSA